jgi:hypothetical protein
MIDEWSAFGGPTMVDMKSKWEDELGRWLKPFLARLGHKARRRMWIWLFSSTQSTTALSGGLR